MRPLSIAPLALLALAACQSAGTMPSSAVAPAPVAAPAPAPAAAPAASAAFDPAGKWSLGLNAMGQQLEVALDLYKLSDGKWAGTVSSAMFPPFPISEATLTGKRMVISFVAPTGDPAKITLDFDGDAAQGEWTMAGDGSKVVGRRNR
ncbi:MAG: hypothetical protein P2975_07605 [Gemmatimonadota bacterium]|jgi:hypothetical protein|nr:hypothetical protein [Gemmatimonadota bacterium]MDQ8152899.1 hypothetical protein [Gemmatimonadota bacterium]MDQ8169744.1 hypothetical protein [Gemmatimonadota bacterium]